VLTLVGLAWVLLLDRAVERGVEAAGTAVVGARVDLASADLQLAEGAVTLRGLAVTNPDRPMQNLLEADELAADIAVGPLLSQRVVVERLSARGVRFGTARETSGAIDRPSAASRALRQRVDAWATGIRIPALSVGGLQSAVDLARVAPDSLRSLQAARALADRAAAVESEFGQQLAGLDPGPRIDSARALASELQRANLLTLGVGGATAMVGRARRSLDGLAGLDRTLTTIDAAMRGRVTDLEAGVRGLADARADDVRWAMGQLDLPVLEGPEVSTAMFGDLALQWARPVLFWLGVIDRYLPPGLDPRRLAGSKRARREGTTVHYPGGGADPRFLVERADLGLVLGGAGVAAGAYAAQLTGLTTDPAIYGQPLRILAGRTEGATGPAALELAAVVDRVSDATRDSVRARARGVALPTVSVGGLDGQVALGQGTAELEVAREADRLDLRWRVVSPAVEWIRSEAPTVRPTRGSQAWVADLMWRAVEGIRDVEIEMDLVGDPRAPSLAVRSNVGRAVAQSLRAELGREVRRVEADVRAHVDGLVRVEADAAEARVAAVRDKLADRVGVPRERLAAAEAELRAQLQRLARIPGVRIP
jgi:hypothetical protein